MASNAEQAQAGRQTRYSGTDLLLALVEPRAEALGLMCKVSTLGNLHLLMLFDAEQDQGGHCVTMMHNDAAVHAMRNDAAYWDSEVAALAASWAESRS